MMIIRPFKSETLADVKNSLGTIERILIDLQQEQTRLEQLIGGGSSGSIVDGDYGDITVSGSGTVMSIDSGVVDIANITPALDAYITSPSPSLDGYIIAMAAAL